MTPKPFTDVAMMLVNGNDPKRLAVALASYAPLIGIRRLTMDDNQDDEHLLLAAQILEEKLPYYVQDHLGLPTPDYIDEILIRLPKLIEFLKAQVRPPRKGNQPPDSRRRVCAGVCLEAWRYYHHGQAQPFNPKLREACEVYWQSCGNPETGEANGSIRNWERFLVWARDVNDEDFRQNFLHYITIPK
jgi:hypothetical protein